FICSLLAVGVAVGLYFGLRPLIGSEEGWLDVHSWSSSIRCLRLL
ncbi:hypothetical protein LEA_03601, partial [human gut metagenome]